MEKTKAAPRLFTREEAQKMLPLVRSIVRDIVDLYRTFKEKVERYQAATEAKRRGQAPPAGFDREAIEAEIEGLKDKVHAAMSELTTLGVELKDFEKGLVDFPMRRGGDVAFLCWMLGEEGIGYWHTRDAGFRGRKPLDDADDDPDDEDGE